MDVIERIIKYVQKIKSWFIFSSSSGIKYGGWVVLDQTTKKATCRDSNRAPQQYNHRPTLNASLHSYTFPNIRVLFVLENCVCFFCRIRKANAVIAARPYDHAIFT
jgi:hypothetical protein